MQFGKVARAALLPSLFLLFLLPWAVMPLVAVIPQPNAPVELREVSSPELEADSALFDVELSEVCGTDVYLQQGRLLGVSYPLVPGHVSVGRLSKIRGTMVELKAAYFVKAIALRFLMCIAPATPAGSVWWPKPPRAVQTERFTA
jgi:hypothetical protein